MKLKMTSFLVLFLCLTVGLMAQRTISGVVTDATTGEPLIGANVLIVGTSTGTITDFDGAYSIGISADTKRLEISYTGYRTQTFDIGTSDKIDAQLTAGEILEEVVVIGYGTTKKSDATGALTAVNDKAFNKGAIVSADQLIAGKIAGVQIQSNTGEPGGQSKVRIRGGTSINASNEPLYVIDGVPISNSAVNPGGFSDGRNPLNFLNPSDIETFTVLKDASATAIYGSRGANGVIIITTKKGKAGNPARLSYDGYYSVAELVGEPDNLDAEAFRNVITFKAPERLEQLGDANTNWYDEMLQTSTGHNHSLNFTGGAENIGYRISAGYQQLKGVIRTSETERTNIGLNYNHSFLEGDLLLNVNLKGAFTKDQFDPNQVFAAWNFDPTQEIYDPENKAFGGFFEYGNTNAPRNPVSGIEQNQEFGRNFRSVGNLDLEYKLDRLIKGLSVKTNLGYDILNGDRKRFQPTTYVNTQVAGYNGEVRIENYIRTNKLLDFYLTYKNYINDDNRVELTAGYSYQDFYEEYPSLRAIDLSTDIFGFNSTRPASRFEANNSVVENRLISFFGRANYSFKDKYLLTVTVRRDGSTRFGEANRWGTFPSAALGWRILQEGFAQGLTGIFSDLKLRVGYGITGNQEIPNFQYLSRYSLSDVRARYQFGEGFITTARPNAYDAALKWEETTSYNIGLDFGFSNGRISGSIEYYYKSTDDLLFTVNVPAGTNLSDRVLTNIGEVENSGIELTLNAVVLDTKDFSWDLNFNAANNKNEVVAIDRIANQGILTGGISGGVGNNVQIHQVGSPISSFFLFKHKLGADGLPLPDGIDHNDDGQINQADIYEDTNNDGTVNDLDKQVSEQPAPKYILGLTSNMSYKGFDLSVSLRSNIGNYMYNNNASVRGYFDRLSENASFVNNLHASTLETKFTRPQYFSDYYLEDASFLRMDNLTLGYTFRPGKGFSSIRLYATGQNLFVITKYKGLDPEVGNKDNIGIDNAPYPRARGFIFGVSLGL
ncbi:MAG: SusC/RagA family TonB-linked outer membrane protein [Saprospiraceae bacterium]|nr:MAG: SusC/RagA family TonB-linked outer membrane protein [Saprospiraceae bacterium]